MRGVRHRLTRSAGGAGSSIFQPTFFLPLQDAGAGAVNTTLAKGLGSVTFTRATTAWAKLSTGLWASVASGTARSHYLGADTTVGAYGGYFAEEARTNKCLQSRDLSNASWTKLNATAAKDQVGIDGVASSASSLTATAGGGSCLQTITEAATLSAFSVFIKRITGTGTVTIQQGATTSEISGSINSSTYTRVELDATVLNPAIGIVLGTNGDKIAVDMVQFENVATGEVTSSPIPTTTIAVARNADVLTSPSSGNANSAGANTLYSEVVFSGVTSSNGVIELNDGTTNNRVTLNSNTSPQFGEGVVVGGVIQANFTGAPALAVNTSYKLVGRANTNDFAAFVNGALVGTDVSGTVPAITTIDIGSVVGGAAWLNGTIKNVKIWTRALTNIQIAGL